MGVYNIYFLLFVVVGADGLFAVSVDLCGGVLVVLDK